MFSWCEPVTSWSGVVTFVHLDRILGSIWRFLMSLSPEAASCQNLSSDMCKMHIQIHPMHAQSHSDICSPLIHYIVSNASVSKQRRAWSDCTNVQADLCLHSPHMPEDMFSHDRVHIKVAVAERCLILEFRCVNKYYNDLLLLQHSHSSR